MRPSQIRFSFGTRRGEKRTKECKRCCGIGVIERQRIEITCSACGGRGYVDMIIDQSDIDKTTDDD